MVHTPLDIVLTFNSSDELFISIDDEEEIIDDSEFEDEFLDEDIFSSNTSDIWFTEDKNRNDFNYSPII